MFFSFPEGCDHISVEQQNFDPEFTDKRGVNWFRAPEHFAPRILNLGLGFHALRPGDKPEGCELDDNAVFAPTAAREIGDQAIKIASISDELRLANEQSQRAMTQMQQMDSQVQFLSARNKDLEEENEKLRERLEELESPTQTAEAFANIKPGKSK